MLGRLERVGKSGVLEHKSGNVFETRNDRGKVTMETGEHIGTHQRSVEQCHPRPLRPFFPKIGGLQLPPKTPIENCAKTNAHREIVRIEGLFGNTECGNSQRLPEFFLLPLLSQERVKLRTSNFVGTFIGSIGKKTMKNVGNSNRGRSQGVPKNFRAPIYRAHRAVIFATAQLSCY